MGGPLTAVHVSKCGIFHFGFHILGETLLGELSVKLCLYGACTCT